MTEPTEDAPEHDHPRPSPNPAAPAAPVDDPTSDGVEQDRLEDAGSAWDAVDGTDEALPLPHEDQERRT